MPDTTHCMEKANKMRPSLHPKTSDMMGTITGNPIRNDDDTSRITDVITTITQA